jgi:hypothetical protein
VTACRRAATCHKGSYVSLDRIDGRPLPRIDARN